MSWVLSRPEVRFRAAPGRLTGFGDGAALELPATTGHSQKSAYR